MDADGRGKGLIDLGTGTLGKVGRERMEFPVVRR